MVEKFFEKMYLMGEEIKNEIIKLLTEKKVESINLLAYYDNNKRLDIPNYLYYNCDDDGYSIGYHIDSIVMMGKKPIFKVSDSDGCYGMIYDITDFTVTELVYVLDTLETLFETIDKFKLPLLKEDEEFCEEDFNK